MNEILRYDLGNLPTIGSLLWWSLSNIYLSWEDFKALLQREGVSLSGAPRRINAREAVIRALRRIETQEEYRLATRMQDGRYFLSRKILTESGPTIVNELVVTADKDHYVVETLSGDQQLAVAVRRHTEYFLGAVLTRDVRSWLVRKLREFNASSIRKMGGVYFVPRTTLSEVQGLTRVVQRLGNSEVYLLPLLDTPRARQQLGGLMTEALQEEIRQLREEFEALQREGASKRKLEGYLLRLRRLRAKAECYEQVLRMKAENLMTSIGEASDAVRRLLVSA